MSLPTINGVGRLVDDPELRFTPSGKAVAKVRLAFGDRKKDDSGTWVDDGEPLFLEASVWNQEAENVAESLTRGMECIVAGKLKQRSYETREGEKRTVYEVAFATIAPTLKFATAKVQKAQRSGGGQQRSQGAGPQDDPWSTNAGPGRSQPQGQQSSSFDDEPPF